MGLLGWIVVGFVAGALARPVTGGGWHLGCLGTIVVGVLGGLIGGVLFNLAGDEGIGDFGLRSMFVAFVGAVVLLAIVGLARRPPRPPHRPPLSRRCVSRPTHRVGPRRIERRRLDLGGGEAEVGLGAGAHLGGAAVGVEVEHDPLALAQHPEDRALERVGREHELLAVGVAHDDALVRRGIEHLDRALHVTAPRASRPCRP